MTIDSDDAAIQELDRRVGALEAGSSSWAALVGEDVRTMRRDLDALIATVADLQARLADG